MDKQKILIADNSEDLPLMLSDLLHSEYHIRCTQDGKEALELLHSFQPHILIMELMLSGLDGISLLHSAAASGLHPMVLIVTRLASEYAMEAVTKLGVDYVINKPCDIHALADRIHDLSQRIDQNSTVSVDPYKQASHLLHMLGFSTKRIGYAYLRDAIVLMAQNPGQSITKELYPTIASLYDCPQANVERSIRTAIEDAWKTHNDALLQQYFPPKASDSSFRPTNATVITALAGHIHLPD